MTPVTTAVILAGGLGKRMLPITAAIPKEMLPVVDRPLIQYAVEEAVASGIRRVVLVTSPGKEMIREYFTGNTAAARAFAAAGDHGALASATAASKLADFRFAVQEQPLGIAHAVACARQWLDEPAFALMFPDDLLLSREPAIGQLLRRHGETGGGVLAVQEVPLEQVANYGVVDVDTDGRVRAIVEKPAPARAPSTRAVVGRYVLTRDILRHIETLRPGLGGELQLTDAIQAQIAAAGLVHATLLEADRYDTGRAGGYVQAVVAAAQRRPDLDDALAAIRRMLSGGDRTT